MWPDGYVIYVLHQAGTSPNLDLSKQELYVRVEAPKGEFGMYVSSRR